MSACRRVNTGCRSVNTGCRCTVTGVGLRVCRPLLSLCRPLTLRSTRAAASDRLRPAQGWTLGRSVARCCRPAAAAAQVALHPHAVCTERAAAGDRSPRPTPQSADRGALPTAVTARGRWRSPPVTVRPACTAADENFLSGPPPRPDLTATQIRTGPLTLLKSPATSGPGVPRSAPCVQISHGFHLGLPWCVCLRWSCLPGGDGDDGGGGGCGCEVEVDGG